MLLYLKIEFGITHSDYLVLKVIKLLRQLKNYNNFLLCPFVFTAKLQ